MVPFFNTKQFRSSFSNYKCNVINGNYDSLVSVVPLKDYIWNETRPLNYIANHRHTISQDLPNWFQVTNGNYMASKSTMMEHRCCLVKNVFLDIREQS